MKSLELLNSLLRYTLYLGRRIRRKNILEESFFVYLLLTVGARGEMSGGLYI